MTMKTVKVAEAYLIRIMKFEQRYDADILIVDGRIARIIYSEIPGTGWKCLIREDQDLWFDDLFLEENGKVRYERQNSATKYLDCDLCKRSEEEFEFEVKKAISLACDTARREFYEHLSDGPLKDYAKEEHDKQIEELKEELKEMQAW